MLNELQTQPQMYFATVILTSGVVQKTGMHIYPAI